MSTIGRLPTSRFADVPSKMETPSARRNLDILYSRAGDFVRYQVRSMEDFSFLSAPEHASVLDKLKTGNASLMNGRELAYYLDFLGCGAIRSPQEARTPIQDFMTPFRGSVLGRPGIELPRLNNSGHHLLWVDAKYDAPYAYLKHNGYQYKAFGLHGVLAAHAQYFIGQHAAATKA